MNVRSHLAHVPMTICLVFSALPPGVAHADATAEAVFDQAVKARTRGDFADACPMFDRAIELSGASAIGGVLAAGECYEAWGKTATAWGHYRKAVGLARANGDARAEKAQAGVNRLEPMLRRLTLVVTPELRKREGLAIALGNQILPAATWGIPMPVDPGVQSIAVHVTGGEKRHEINIAEAQQQLTLDVWPELAPGAGPATPTTPTTPAPQATAPTEPGRSGKEPRSDGLGVLGISGGVLMGAGAIATGVGVGLGFVAKGAYDDALGHPLHACNQGACNALGVTAVEDARTQGDVGTAVFFSGLGVVALGAALIIADALSDSPETKHGALVLGDYALFPSLTPGLGVMR